MDHDAFHTLGLCRHEISTMEPSDSGDKAVKKAFQRLALVHHPDKGGDAEKFNQLRQAYAEIATEERRADYIQWTIHRCPKRFSDYFALDDARRVSVVVLVLWPSNVHALFDHAAITGAC